MGATGREQPPVIARLGRALREKAVLPGQWAAERARVEARDAFMAQAAADTARVLVELRGQAAEVGDALREARAGGTGAAGAVAEIDKLLAGAGTDDSPAPRAARVCRVSLPDGLAFDVFLDPEADDPLTGELSRGYAYNDHLIRLMLDHVEPGDVVLDLGAHVGVFTLAAAAAGARVVAVEASPASAGLLRAAAARNGFDHVVVIGAAAGAQAGEAWFLNRGPFGLVIDHDYDDAFRVPTVTVADVVRELGWGPIAFVKLDVEGSESAVLTGMAGLVDAADAPPILYESNGHTLFVAGDTPNRLMSQFEAAGYGCYLVDGGRLVGVRSHDVQAETSVDYLAVKRLRPRLAQAGWAVDDEMAAPERARRLLAEFAHPHFAHRRYALSALIAAPGGADLLADPEVRDAVERLAADEHPEVRELAGRVLGREPATVAPAAEASR